MGDKSRRDRVGLGLIGLGPSWEQSYREPLIRLQNRPSIRLVYDPVEARSRSVAGELQAEVAGSLHQMLARPSLQGLLVLDPGWCGSGVLLLISACGKPAFLGSPVLRKATALMPALLSQSADADCEGISTGANDQLIPELGLRFTPASCRLRELIATKLGPAKRIEIDCDLTADPEKTAALVDWCCDIMGNPSQTSVNATKKTALVPQLDIEFATSASTDLPPSGRNRIATLRHRLDASIPLRMDVECERGHAILEDRTHIVWRTSAEMSDELLTDERMEIEILIDQFCRRALGGLSPVGRLSDFDRAMKIAASIQPLSPDR